MVLSFVYVPWRWHCHAETCHSEGTLMSNVCVCICIITAFIGTWNEDIAEWILVQGYNLDKCSQYEKLFPSEKLEI